MPESLIYFIENAKGGMKMFRRIMAILYLIFLIGACGLRSEPEAQVKLLSWYQTRDLIYEYPEGPIVDDIWRQVEIRYQIKNVGDVDIDYYKIWFAVRYSSSVRFKVVEGIDLPQSKLERNSVFVDFYPNRKVESVEIHDYEVGIF